MNTQSFIKEMKEINKKIQIYLDDQENSESNYKILINLFDNFKIKEDSLKIREIIHLLSIKYKYHETDSSFYPKIEQILIYLKDAIKQLFTKDDIYCIFRRNQILLHWFFNENIISMNRLIISEVNDMSFSNEIQSYLNPSLDHKKTEVSFGGNLEQYNQKFSKICQIILKDSIDEFTSYISQNEMSLTDLIIDPEDVFEEEMTIIEYSAKHKSIQIFKYLVSKGIELNSKIWDYAIENNCIEMVQILAQNKIVPESNNNNDNPYLSALYESIKHHNNDIANYIIDHLIDHSKIDKTFFYSILEFHNFEFFPDDFSNLDIHKLFSSFCQYDYSFFVKHFLNEVDVDVCQENLITSIGEKNVEIVRLLLSKPNIDVNINDDNTFMTLLCMAAEAGICDIVKFLLSNPKIDVNLKI